MNQERKSILIISSFAYPHAGGVELFTGQIAKRFIQAGVNVTFICLNTEKTSDQEVIDGVKYIRLPSFTLINGRLPFPLINSKFLELTKTIQKKHFDFIIINVKLYVLSLMGSWFAKKRKIPAILIEHGSGHFDLKNPFLTLVGRIFEHLVTYFVRGTQVEFYGVSEAVNDWLLHFGIESSGVISNGVDSNYVPDVSTSYRKTYNIPDDKILVSYVGRLVEEKGILELINAVQQLSTDRFDLFLMIAGDGPLSDSFTVFPERIKYLGKLEHDQVFRLLQETDVFVLPTRMKEGLPTVVLEAGSRGCAVIATPSGGIKEIIIDDRFGLLIQDSQTHTIKNALLYLIANPEKRLAMGVNLKARVQSTFDWGIIFNQLVNLVDLKIRNL